jgi:AcrR family transcriptional regulator
MSVDKRVRKTQSALLDALMSLMAAHGYRGVSVDALLARAKVARSTFYAHFHGKDDLLRANVKRLGALAAAEGGMPEERLMRFSRVFYEHAHENRDLYLSLLRDPDQGAAVFKKLQGVLAEVATAELTDARYDGEAVAPAVQFFVGAQWAVLAWWLERKPSLGVDYVHDRFERLARPVLASLAN